jgi:hypothetical protein
MGNRKLAIDNVKWPGREADEASANSTIPDSHRSAGMSHAPITCDLNWCPRKDLNLQPLVCRTSAPSVELLGRKSSRQTAGRQSLMCFPCFLPPDFWSELESNQPLALFRPAIIRLSYPTNEHCQLPIFDCRLVISGQLVFGNRQLTRSGAFVRCAPFP